MTASHAASVQDEVSAGTRLGRYEILLSIAQGGMARVWAARQHGQRGFSKVVAIKTILPQLAQDPSFEAMFLDEARLASGIHHPNVCEIFDLGEEAGALYIAMEWVNGEALSRVLKPPVPRGQKAIAQRLNARVAARIVADAAKGLHAAHELRDEMGRPLGVVHRDVSPQNILVSLDGVVKVTDFGVAKALRTDHEATMAGQVKGKVAYMAPEQARGAAIDRRSDVFALGIVLYEITTGTRPFAGENEIEVMRSLAAGYFDPPSSVVPGYPPELEAIVFNAMAMDPARRFPTAEAMRHALEEWLARSGPIVTEVHVAATVRERVGILVDERVARIRERTKTGTLELPATETAPPYAVPPTEASSSFASVVSAPGTAPSGVSGVSYQSAPSAVSHIAPVVATAPPFSAPRPASGSSAAKTALIGVAVGVGVFALVAVGGGSYWVLKSRSRATAAVQPAASTPSVAGSPAPAAAIADTRIVLVEPKSGVTLLVDGVVQPVGQLSITRPAPGAERTLTARAAGYKDREFKLESESTSIEITLDKDMGEAAQDKAGSAEKPPEATKPSEPAKPAEAANPSEAAKPEKSSEKSTPPSKPKPVKPDIPDNPF